MTVINNDSVRGLFVWDDVANSEEEITSLVTFCKVKEINVVYASLYSHLLVKKDFVAVQNLLNSLHSNGIKVHALFGNSDYGSKKQWVVENVGEAVVQYNSVSSDKIDGVLLDAEYWSGSAGHHTQADAIGMMDLIRALKIKTGTPVGFSPPYWFADPKNNQALDVVYDGHTMKEGQHMIYVADYVVVQDYFSDPQKQIEHFNPWFDFAVSTGRNVGLVLASEVSEPSKLAHAYSYNRLQVGDEAHMQSSLASVSQFYTMKHGADRVWWGCAIEQYRSYRQMK